MDWRLLSLICYLQLANSFTSITKRSFRLKTHDVVTVLSLSSSETGKDGEWLNLIPDKDGIVKKLILEEGKGSVPSQGSNIEINYVGKLGGTQANWSVDDVVEAWLQYQQGLSDILEEPFRINNINGQILMDSSIFTEEFVSNELGITNKMQCKKTIMAAKRLWKQVEEFPEGFEFDSSKERGKLFSFVLGQGKVIKGMDMGVSSMKVGEKARILCRSDYGYGSEGYRTKKGDVVVPPFRTLIFDVELVSSSSS